MINSTIITTRKIYPRISLTLVRNNYFDSKQSLWFEEKKKPNSLLLPYYYSFKFQDHLRIARPRASPLLRRSIRYLFPLENVTPSFIESIPRRVFSSPREKIFPFRKIVLGNFPGPVRSEGRGAAERKEYKIKCGVARGRASGGEKGEREKETGLSLSRGSSKRTGIGDRSERRLLGSGQWLAATANFSSPCGRMTVTFFRSKAGRILSSGAFSAPFCLSSSQATDSRTSLLHGTKPSSLSLSLSSALPFVFTSTIFSFFFSFLS